MLIYNLQIYKHKAFLPGIYARENFGIMIKPIVSLDIHIVVVRDKLIGSNAQSNLRSAKHRLIHNAHWLLMKEP